MEGRRVTPQTVLIRLFGHDDTAPSMPAETFDQLMVAMRARGIFVREIRIPDGRPPQLPEGTVVTSLRGELGLVVKATKGGFFVDFGDGPRSVGRPGDLALGARALRWSRPWRAQVGDVLRGLREPMFRAQSTRLAWVTLMSQAPALLGPIAFREAFDVAWSGRSLSDLLLVAGLLVAVGVHASLCLFLRQRVVRYLEAQFVARAHTQTVAHYLGAPFSALEQKKVSHATLRFDGAEQASRLCFVLAVACFDGAFLALQIALLAWFSPVTAMFAIGVAVTLLVINRRIARIQQALRSACLEAGRVRQETINAITAGIETVKLENAGERLLRRLRNELNREHHAELQSGARETLGVAMAVSAERFLISLAMLPVGAGLITGAMDLGTCVAVLQIIGGIAVGLRPVAQIPQRLSDLAALRATSPRIAPSEPIETVPTTDALVFERVWFRHGDDKSWILRDFSFQIPRGTHQTLRWPSGTGKTTLLRLAAGLYRQTHGVIARCQSNHDGIYYLPAQTTLLPVSVGENLRLLSRGADETRLRWAMHETGLDAFVATLPKGEATEVARGGGQLSQGQRQWIALTAAVASTSPVVLLDEAMSHLDPSLRAKLDVRALFSGRTTLSVAHGDARPVEVGWSQKTLRMPAIGNSTLRQDRSSA